MEADHAPRRELHVPVAEVFLSEAELREAAAAQHPEEPRHLESANALRTLAAFVAAPQDGSPAPAELAKLETTLSRREDDASWLRTAAIRVAPAGTGREA